MGWFGTEGTKKELIELLTQPVEVTATGTKRRCLRHCYRKDRSEGALIGEKLTIQTQMGVLWSLWESRRTSMGGEVAMIRYIRCDLILEALNCRGKKVLVGSALYLRGKSHCRRREDKHHRQKNPNSRAAASNRHRASERGSYLCSLFCLS